MSDKSTMDFSARAPGPFDLTADRGNLHGKQRSQESNQVGTGSQQSNTFRDTFTDTFRHTFYIFLPHPFLYTSFFHILPFSSIFFYFLPFSSQGHSAIGPFVLLFRWHSKRLYKTCPVLRVLSEFSQSSQCLSQFHFFCRG